MLHRESSSWLLRAALAGAAVGLLTPALLAQGSSSQTGHGGEPGRVPGVLPRTTGPADTAPPRGRVPGAREDGGRGARPSTGAASGGPVIARPAVDIETLIYFLERDQNDWRIWWRLNRDPLLVVDPGEVLPLSADGGFYMGGDGDRDSSRIVKAPVLQEQVLPALVEALGRERSPAVRSAVLLALGRAGSLVGEDTARLVLDHVADPDRNVCEAAIVAAGLQADPYVVRRVVHLAHGCEAAVELLGGRAADTRLSAFAALAVGLGVQRSENEDLRRFVIFDLARTASNPFAAPDVPVACVAAIGLLPLPWKGEEPSATRPAPHASREGQLAWLLQAVAADDVHRQVRGHAALALGRLGHDARGAWREQVVETLLALVDEDSDACLETRQGAAIALGLIGDCDEDALDRKVRRALVRATREGDTLTRRFALISIGRVAGRAGDGEGLPDQGRGELAAHLLTQLVHGRSGLDAWSALALGNLQHELFDQGVAPSREVQRALARKLEDCRTPTTAGAFGLGLALALEPEADRRLAEALERFEGDEPAAAALSLALGLTGGREARALLVELLEQTSGRPGLLHDAALALVLTGDFDGTPRLVEVYERAGALDSRAALASALGRTGDTRAIPPLLATLGDETVPQTERALAARGLGWLLDQGGAPVWTPLSCDLNWGADTSSLAGLGGGDFLELLRDF
jgi:HEAT repeat protein